MENGQYITLPTLDVIVHGMETGNISPPMFLPIFLQSPRNHVKNFQPGHSAPPPSTQKRNSPADLQGDVKKQRFQGEGRRERPEKIIAISRMTTVNLSRNVSS